MKIVGFFISEFFTSASCSNKHNRYLFHDIDYFIFPQAYFGFRYILSEINRNEYKIIPVFNIKDIETCDYLLISITSYKDYYTILSVFKNVKKKPIIIVGGAGFINLIPLIDIIDIGVFGRGEGLINTLLTGNINSQEKKYIWVKEDDPDIKKIYNMRPAEISIKINHGNTEKIFNENSIGCKRKCFFCAYAWKNKYIYFSKRNNYNSGYSDREDCLINFKWKHGQRYLITAIDGVSEKSRYIIGKNISNNQLVKKFMERNMVEPLGKSIQVKLYNIIGFPFEQYTDNYYDEFNYHMRKIDTLLKGKICILLNNSHFIPKPLTPMESEKLNLIDFKKISYHFEEGNYLKIIKSYAGASYRGAALEVLIDRLLLNEKDKFDLLLCDYGSIKKLNNDKGIEIINRYIPGIFDERNEIVPYLNRQKQFKKNKKIFYKRKIK